MLHFAAAYTDTSVEGGRVVAGFFGTENSVGMAGDNLVDDEQPDRRIAGVPAGMPLTDNFHDEVAGLVPVGLPAKDRDLKRPGQDIGIARIGMFMHR